MCAADMLSLAILKPPSEFQADICLGSTQRFGVPLGYGGPHAAYFACKDKFKRKMPGRIVGISRDSQKKQAFRLTLQTREQHIRREKATSNICTSQALLANMAAMYAVYHGPVGLKEIAKRIHSLTAKLALAIDKNSPFELLTRDFFDTIVVKVANADITMGEAEKLGYNLRKVGSDRVGVSLDETITNDDLKALLRVFHSTVDIEDIKDEFKLPPNLERKGEFLQQEIFSQYHSETEMLRYIHHLQKKDLSLTDSMIPLGSCTMKLNATTEMIPITWPEFSDIHPFVPQHQCQGYQTMLKELSADLAEITGFDAVSLQPNSGAQGEFTGLRVIRSFHLNNSRKRKVCLVPVSAHGTNPASAVMAGMDVVAVKCRDNGELCLEDLAAKIASNKDKIAAIMITYPSTFGVFEETVTKACEMVHEAGGQVYMDGANLNAQVGLCRPAEIGADVCHLNLHKTY